MPEKTSLPRIGKLENGFKLAEQWINSMSKCPEDEEEVESEGRPPRLGLGAKTPLHAKTMRSNDPVERKLLAKLNAIKRKAAEGTKESTQSAGDGQDEDSNSDEDFESRSNAFAKRKPVPSPSSLQSKKKRK